VQSEIGIYFDAPSRVVFDLVRDVVRWPNLLPHYRKVTVESHDGAKVHARMEAVRPGRVQIPVGWTSEQWSDDTDPADLQLRFVHVAGPTRGMDVTWHIRPASGGSSVTIVHDFARRLPLLGDEAFPRLVDRLFIRPIAGRTLATFKQLAER
jgi:aromatase